MERTQISLRTDQRAALDEVSSRTGRSVAAVIRELIDSAFELEHSKDADVANLRSSAGGWPADDRGVGSDYVELLRSGRRIDSTTRT